MMIRYIASVSNVLLRIPARRRANDRIYPIAAASPTERTIQSRLSGTTPKASHECVLSHTTTLSVFYPRATGSNRRISIYLSTRAGSLPRDCTSTKACLDTNCLRQLAQFWDNRAVYYHQASLDPIILSANKKPAIFLKCNTAVQWRENDATNRFYFLTSTFICTQPSMYPIKQ